MLNAPHDRVKAELVDVAPETDLALLRLSAGDLPPLPFGDSKAVRPGRLVGKLGSSLGLADSVTMGIVSATARQLRPEGPVVFLQADTAINPGSSGGPLARGARRDPYAHPLAL